MIALPRIYRDPWYAGALAALAAIVAVAALAVVIGARSSATPRQPQASPAPPQPTVDATAATLDYARGVDLGAIAGALGAYRLKHGAYPDTGGKLTVLCGEAGEEPGCALIEVNAELPLYRSGEPYRYASDGRSYTIVSPAAQPAQDMSACPDDLPASLTPAICLHGGD
jgi:hypothetical protein